MREAVVSGEVQNGPEVRAKLKSYLVSLLRSKGGDAALQLSDQAPSVILVVGVNGGGKTTTLGKLAYRLQGEGARVRQAVLCCGGWRGVGWLWGYMSV